MRVTLDLDGLGKLTIQHLLVYIDGGRLEDNRNHSARVTVAHVCDQRVVISQL